MNKLKDFFGSIKKDYIYWFVILIITTIFFLFLHNNIYLFLFDFGREVYIPTEIASGKVLYKDILCIFAPLGYVLNAFIVKVFPNCFLTFSFIGLFLSLIILIAIYKISKMFIKAEISFVLVLFLLPASVFFPAFITWINPYSYSVIYALAAISWSLYFSLKFLETDDYKCIFYSTFLYGFSISSKYDFCLFIIPLFLLLIYKKVKLSIYLYVILCCLFIPVLTLIYLFLIGNSVETIKNAIDFIYTTSKSQYLCYFYQFNGSIPSLKILEFFKITNIQNILFCFIGYFSLFSLFFAILKKYNFKIIFFNFAIILICIKSIFFIRLDYYGSYCIPFLYLLFIIFLLKICRNNVRISLLLTLILFVFYTLNIIEKTGPKYLEKLSTEKGTVKIDKAYNPKIAKKVIDFIYNNTKKDDIVLILPEGVVFNYISGRNSDSVLFQLNPNNYEVLTEEYIVNRIDHIKPDYIIVYNYYYLPYGGIDFICDYGVNISNNYIMDKYNLYSIYIGDTYLFANVYEKREE